MSRRKVERGFFQRAVNGHKDGAWIQVLIAAAATSRLRFPELKKKQGDKAAFTAFIREVSPTIIAGGPAVTGGVNVIFKGNSPNSVSMDVLVYEQMRCALVHEAELGPNVQISESKMIDGKLVANLKCATPIAIPDFWVINLAKAVQDAPENAALFANDPIFVQSS